MVIPLNHYSNRDSGIISQIYEAFESNSRRIILAGLNPPANHQ